MESAMASTYTLRTNNETAASFHVAGQVAGQVSQRLATDAIVGESLRLKSVLEQVGLGAPTDSTVLILGEPGTGKELIARAIHDLSSRSARPFIRVNCAAIPPSLIISELFGHEKGAFTGALQRRQGRFEAANGGTIFLDEIGELPMETQIALLRVIQEREFARGGSSLPLSVDEAWLRREVRPARTMPPLASSMAEREREMIEAALADSEGRVAGPSGAAAKLGIPRQTLDSKIATLQISKLRFKARRD